MDRREQVAPRPDGARCAGCGARVPQAGVRILARSDDLSFLEVACPSCGMDALAIAVGADGPLDGVTDWEAPAISADDVEAIRGFLAVYEGDVDGLFARDGQAGRRRGPVGDSSGSAA